MVSLLRVVDLQGRAVFEAEAIVSGFQYVAVVGKPIEKRSGHFRIAEDSGPLAEAKVGGDDDIRRAMPAQRPRHGHRNRYNPGSPDRRATA